MPTYKVPATVKWAEIRRLIGDSRTQDLITLRYGPKLLGPPAIKLQRVGLEHMLAYLEGHEIPGLKSGFYQAIPATFRAYFQESPRARGKMIVWLKQKLNETTVTQPEPQLTPPSGILKAAGQVVAQQKQTRKKGRAKVTA